MPGRQAHGRPLLTGPSKAKPKRKSKAKLQSDALGAFGIASAQLQKPVRLPRAQNIEIDEGRRGGKRRKLDDDDDDDEDEEEERRPRQKRVKESDGADAGGSDGEFGSDSEGNEWMLGGLVDGHGDSEIDSDEAFGDSDDETLEKRKNGLPKAGARGSDDESDEEDGDSLGDDAIDLAEALDQVSEDSEEDPDEDEESDMSSEDAATSVSDESEDDTEKLAGLGDLVAGLAGADPAEEGAAKTSTRQKIALSDLGLGALTDKDMQKSMKLMSREEKSKRPGTSKKLEVPLARRQQDRLLRAAAYEKTKETLDKWTESVKHLRRAEHVVFPLPQNNARSALDNTELQALDLKESTNELEQTIMSIMEKSGLPTSKEGQRKGKDDDGQDAEMKALANERRLQRELNSREAKRARRIKKIKSKAYHRVHRRKRERDEKALKEAMAEEGELDSDEERETLDRQRALERVGARHRQSKWAKMGGQVKRAVWDDDYRSSLADMTRREQELLRRKEGRGGEEGAEADESDDSLSGDEDDEARLRRKLDEAGGVEEEEPRSGLMSLRFMKRAEEAMKQRNDELVKQIKRDLDSEAEEEEEPEEVGRRKYGMNREADADEDAGKAGTRKAGKAKGFRGAITEQSVPTVTPVVEPESNPSGGAWSKGEARRCPKASAKRAVAEIDLNANISLAAPKPSNKQTAPRSAAPEKAREGGDTPDDSDQDDMDMHLPMAIRDQELVARAFAGEDVVERFEREKAELAEEQDEKTVDNSLPGWGGWAGQGIARKTDGARKNKFVTKVDGVKKSDRKDAKLEKVIVNEKRLKKNDRYLASGLPFPFENRQQYERSLRLPVGPEWMTKESFQDGTKPRVIVKQGIIGPMAKPIA